jgi:hypothetical protein
MDSLTFAVLLMILTAQAFYLAKEFIVVWRRNPQDFPLFFVLISSFLFSLPPAYYVLLTGHFEALQFGYPLSTWCFGLILEVVFYAVFIATLILKRRAPLMESVARDLNHIPRPTQFLLFIALFSGVIYLLLWGPWSTSGYETAGSYVHINLSNPEVVVGGIQTTIFLSVLFPSVCVLLFYIPKRAVPVWVLPLLWIVFAYGSFKAFAYGSRGGVLEVVFVVSSCLFAAGKHVKPVVYVVVCILFLSIFSSALIIYRGNAERYVGLSLWDKVRIIFENKKMEDGDEHFQDWAEKCVERLDAVQDGGILAEEAVNSHEFASFRPYVGALVAPVPRYFWGNKPLPLSDNDAVSGLPWYRVMEYRGESWNNGSVATSAVAYCQFGWLGLIFTAIFGAVLLRFLTALLVRGGAVGLLFFLSFCAMTHFRLPVSIDETIFVFAQVLLPLIVACFFYGIPAWIAVRDQNRMSLSVSRRPGIQVIGH